VTTYPYGLLGAAVSDALRAPSVHNTQPWRWRLGPGMVELHADWDRHVPATDPDRRDLLISCGAALHHLRVALAARGLTAEVTLLPDVDAAGHLATVEVHPGPVDARLAALHPALYRRRTDRRRFAGRPVTTPELAALADSAAGSGVVSVPVTGAALDRLAVVLDEAARRQVAAPGYPAELHQWTHRYAYGHDGVPATSVPAMPTGEGRVPLRAFGRGLLEQPTWLPGEGEATDGAAALVVTTAGDDPVDALRAGEAASAILLVATAAGMATTPLSQGLEVTASRHEIRVDVLGVPEHTQLVIRVGWPVSGAPELPATPRRAIEAVRRDVSFCPDDFDITAEG
jgi:nitroreductase